jgi:hypothetical protein
MCADGFQNFRWLVALIRKELILIDDMVLHRRIKRSVEQLEAIFLDFIHNGGNSVSVDV